MNDIKFNNNNNNNNNNSDMVVEDTNFYALPVSKNQYFAIDIGTEDVVDIDAQNSKSFIKPKFHPLTKNWLLLIDGILRNILWLCL